MGKKDVIEVTALSKYFDRKPALKNIGFSIRKGEIFGFLGPSGAGKTTMINILTNQLNSDSGEAKVFSKPVTKMNSEDMEKIGIVSDKSGYYEKLSVFKNLLIYGKLFNVSKVKIDDLLKQVGLYESRNKPAEKLSTGMKQRMLLARALINQPELLFLDEPTSGLDPTTTKKIHELLLELSKRGTTIFLTTHDMNEATILCNRLALLNEGSLIEFGSPAEIISKYNKSADLKITFVNGEQVKIPYSKFDQFIKNVSEKVLSIRSCEPTLEDIFINLTGVKLDVQ